jgi:hypothetical protein
MRGVYAFHYRPVLIPLLIRDIEVTAAAPNGAAIDAAKRR